jgi:hypothetical protein
MQVREALLMTSRLVPILESAASTSDPCSSLADAVLSLYLLYSSGTTVRTLTQKALQNAGKANDSLYLLLSSGTTVGTLTQKALQNAGKANWDKQDRAPEQVEV